MTGTTVKQKTSKVNNGYIACRTFTASPNWWTMLLVVGPVASQFSPYSNRTRNGDLSARQVSLMWVATCQNFRGSERLPQGQHKFARFVKNLLLDWYYSDRLRLCTRHVNADVIVHRTTSPSFVFWEKWRLPTAVSANPHHLCKK